MTTRRTFLTTGAAAAASVMSPFTPAKIALADVLLDAPVVPVTPPSLGWLVGQEDQSNYERIYAPTKADAIREWASMHIGADKCPSCGFCFVTGGGVDADFEHDDCDECNRNQPHASRVKLLDPYEGKDVPDRVKYRLGFWIPDCSRCDWQPDGDECGEASDYGRLVGEHFVCEDCMTFGDWCDVDPERANEMLDDMFEREYGPEI